MKSRTFHGGRCVILNLSRAAHDGQDSPTLTAPQAGAILGLTGERVRQLARAGRLQTVPTPFGPAIVRASVEALAAERRRNPPRPGRRPRLLT